MSAPVAYSHTPLPKKPKVPIRCRIKWHDWETFASRTIKDSDGAVVLIKEAQKCKKCPAARAIQLCPGVPYPQYPGGFYRYA